jgi:hypothetical protein
MLVEEDFIGTEGVVEFEADIFDSSGEESKDVVAAVFIGYRSLQRRRRLDGALFR